MVQLLLDHEADPDFEDENDLPPLHWCAMRDEITPMRAILQHGAEVNPGGDYDKPLHEAALHSPDTVKLLVEYGADVKAGGLLGNTPLHLAAAAGKTDMVEFLVERWPEGMREKNPRGYTPLRLAALRETERGMCRLKRMRIV
jgi:ankyrin repeat protein